MVAAAWLEGDFVLRSGRRSRYYFDKYLFETQPGILRRVAASLAPLVPPMTQRLVLVRKEAKGYGTSRTFEGILEPDDRVTVIEDVLTTGGAAIDAVEKVRQAGGEVVHLLAVLDRQEGAAENLARLQVPFTPLFTRADLEAARGARVGRGEGGA